MSGHSSIEWTWNLVVGCMRVMDGCDHCCYAFALHDRRHALYAANGGLWCPKGEPMPGQYALPFSKVQLLPERLVRLHRETRASARAAGIG